jgi:putative redox protein
MTAKVTYDGDLRTSSVHVRSGSAIETDAPVDNHGKGERFSPTDLVAVALATCILTTIGLAAEVHDINIDGAECDVTKIMVPDPRRIGEIVINISFPKGQQYTDKQKSKMKHIADTCPVHQTLHPDCIRTVTFEWPA